MYHLDHGWLWGILFALFFCVACAEPSAERSSDEAEPAAERVETAPTDGAEDALPALDEPVPPPVVLEEADLRNGWIALFDGESLFGWEATSNANWRVEDGTIVVDSGDKGFLCTTTQFADYELQLEFQAAAGTNSGVFLRTELDPGDVATDCYELNIAPGDNPFPTGSLVKRAKVEQDLNVDNWQSYQVTVQGDQVRVVLDGTLVLEYQDPNPLGRGRISLQLNEGRVAFRNIKLRPLGVQPLFNGLDLTGWTPAGEEAEFGVTDDGWLTVKNGPGQLETTEQFGDFSLQLECLVNAPHLNSGVFFRCIPGDTMMGYESQIHNGFRLNRRELPMDGGTGAIFRRQDARLVVADDGAWFYKTLIADGPHMAVWVNGYQVNDWVDTRDANENPRRGLRLEPGTIMLQAHDPTTDFCFRNLRIVEMSPRRPPVN